MLMGLSKHIRNKHLHLLIFLILLLFFFPFFEQYMKPQIPFVSMLFLASLIVTLWSLSLPKKTFVFCVVIAALIFALELGLKLLPQGICYADTAFVTWILYAIFTAACVILMIKKIFSFRYVAFDTIIGGINIYLLLAFIWVILYHLINFFDPNAFNIHGNMSTTRLLYFSYTTISTLGSGDILPVNKYAMTLRFFEAIIGQLYLAIFVAMLVGMRISDRTSPKSE